MKPTHCITTHQRLSNITKSTTLSTKLKRSQHANKQTKLTNFVHKCNQDDNFKHEYDSNTSNLVTKSTIIINPNV
jgi:hypothetical protein